MTKGIVKSLVSNSAKNIEDESRNAKRTAALEAIAGEATLEEAEARADDKPHAPLGADEFGMPILPTPKPGVATESEATRVTSVAAEPANRSPEPKPATLPATKVKAVKAKQGKKPSAATIALRFLRLFTPSLSSDANMWWL